MLVAPEPAQSSLLCWKYCKLHGWALVCTWSHSGFHAKASAQLWQLVLETLGGLKESHLTRIPLTPLFSGTLCLL